MRKTIYLHVGYPKTATTTIQKHYFQRLKGVNYLGLLYDGKESYSCFSKYFEYLITAREDLISIHPHASKEIYNCFDDTPSLLSDEKVIGSLFTPRLNNYGFMQHTSAFAAARSIRMLLPSELFDVKILFTIRRQWDSIPSKYAQSYTKTYSKIPKINKFDKFVDDILSNQESFIRFAYDYENVINVFATVFGEDQIKIMPYEFFVEQESEFIIRLLEFLNAETIPSLQKTAPKENVKRAGKAGHKHSELTLYDQVALLKNKIAPNLRQPESINLEFLKYIKVPFQKSPGNIMLSPEVKEKLIRLYSSSNKNLSDRFGLDLGKYNYFV